MIHYANVKFIEETRFHLMVKIADLKKNNSNQ